jgi:tetratricopeptide (TPR) repeat protein
MLFLLFSAGVLAADMKDGFAGRLFVEGDYLRAIGEYKRMGFFSADPGSTLYFQCRIGECYRHLGDYEMAKAYYDEVFLKIGNDKALQTRVAIGSAICLINRNDTEYARIILDDVQAPGVHQDSLRYLTGVSFLKERRWSEADDAFKKIASPSLKASAYTLLKDVSSKRLKSPKTAFLLSAFIPGAGQLYAERPFKGIISFSLNVSLGYLIYKAYREERNLDGFLIFYFGLQRFYFGNLEQARRYTAEYNQSIQEEIMVE